MHVRKIVFINVAKDPHPRQIGDREGIATRQRLYPGCAGHLLIGDHARDGCFNIHNPRWMILVHAKHAQMLLRGFNIHRRLRFGVFSHLKIVQGDCTLVVKSLRAIELLVGQGFVRDRFAIIGESRCHVRALHAKQHLPLLHVVAKARSNFHHAAAGQRDHRHRPADIWTDHAVDGKGNRLKRLARLHDGKLLGMIHLQNIHIGLLFNLCGRRRPAAGLRFSRAAAKQKTTAGENSAQQHRQTGAVGCIRHSKNLAYASPG